MIDLGTDVRMWKEEVVRKRVSGKRMSKNTSPEITLFPRRQYFRFGYM